MPNKLSEEKVIGVTLISLIILIFINIIINFNFLDSGYLVVLIANFCKFLVIKSSS